MGRGYWLPPKAEDLAAYDGFYIDSDAIYSGDTEKDWNRFLELLCKKLSFHEKTLRKQCAWKPCSAGQSRFVVLQNQHVDIIVEDVDDYVAVYAVIPEDCEFPGYAKRSFKRYISILQTVLTDLYPGKIRKRINSQHTKLVG